MYCIGQTKIKTSVVKHKLFQNYCSGRPPRNRHNTALSIRLSIPCSQIPP